MKKSIYLLLLLACNLCIAQSTGLKMTTTFPENKEVDQLLRFEGIDMYRTTIAGTNLKDSNYYIAAKEIWKGKVKSVDTLFNSATFPVSVIKGDTLTFNVLAVKSGAKTLKVMFDFGRFSINREYKAPNTPIIACAILARNYLLKPENLFMLLPTYCHNAIKMAAAHGVRYNTAARTSKNGVPSLALNTIFYLK